MADAYGVLHPLTARQMVGFVSTYMEPKKDTVPVPHGFISLYAGMIKKLGFDGPFAEMASRLKPLIEKYPQERFSGAMNSIESDGKQDDEPWLWVSMVPYRLFETFCCQHVHGWWFRYNLTRNMLEFVAFNAGNSEKEVIPICEMPEESAKSIPEWKRPD